MNASFIGREQLSAAFRGRSLNFFTCDGQGPSVELYGVVD